jgi:hypothetical protein
MCSFYDHLLLLIYGVAFEIANSWPVLYGFWYEIDTFYIYMLLESEWEFEEAV